MAEQQNKRFSKTISSGAKKLAAAKCCYAIAMLLLVLGVTISLFHFPESDC
jgi:hypothetical protein